MTTERLYYHDAYLQTFDATILEQTGDGTRLYLDRSAFYPTSGGQPHDLGAINGIPVVDVVDEGDRVVHITAAPVSSREASCTIDWVRRYDLMQQHTGQHLLSAIFADVFGWPTVSVHFGDEISTLDLDTPSVPPEAIREAETRANAVIAEHRSVSVSFEDAATAAGLRKASDREGILRVISIDGIDRSACGGTHVRSTAEIQLVQLRRQEKMRKSARLEFVCGTRALRRARADFEALASTAQVLSAALDDVPGLVAAQAQELRDLTSARRKLEGELATYQAKERWGVVAPDGSGVRWIVEEIAGPVDDRRAFAIAVSTLERAACLVVSPAQRSILLAASADSGIDAGGRLKAALGAAGGRGGGSPRLAQGSVPSADAVPQVVASLTA